MTPEPKVPGYEGATTEQGPGTPPDTLHRRDGEVENPGDPGPPVLVPPSEDPRSEPIGPDTKPSEAV